MFFPTLAATVVFWITSCIPDPSGTLPPHNNAIAIDTRVMTRPFVAQVPKV